MTPLAGRIKAMIGREGPMPVERFMALCLGDPDDGYYMNRDPLGRAGDFITAPEVSQMFGELIGLWCVDLWQRLQAPSPLKIIELGPGRGTLMADLMRAAGKVAPDFTKASDIHLVDISPALRSSQKRTLAKMNLTAHWHDTLADCSAGPSIIIANEFFDALPIRQFVKTGDGWRERGVDIDTSGNLCFAALPGPVDADAVPGAYAAAPVGAIFERCPAASDVVADIARRFSQDPGAALIIDYGHVHSGPGETLQAISGHRFAPVLEQPGEIDLTAHVDFEHLAAIATSHGLDVFGPLQQGAFLNSLGLDARAQILSEGADAATRKDIDSAVDRLAGEDEMGQHFKVMIFTSHGSPLPEPFASGR